jgi:hypothetical protein|tara:strand:- start:2611 stop:2805 length:195 start_codon:yes stop_codon:yes gene_type:complete
MTKKKDTITPSQAVAEYQKAGFGSISTQTIVVWIQNKTIVGRKVGGRWHVDKDKFQLFLEENKL